MESVFKKLNEMVARLDEIEQLRGIWKRGDIGSHGLTRLAKEGHLTKEEIFRMPDMVRPFIDEWDKAVDEIWLTPKMWDKKGLPNYQKVMSIWKDHVENKYGFRPSRSKEKTMVKYIEDEVAKARKILNAVRREQNKKRKAKK